MQSEPDLPDARCGKTKLIRVCRLWRKLEEQGTSEAGLRAFLKLFYGVVSRKELTPHQADEHIAECSQLLNERLRHARLIQSKRSTDQ